MTYPITSANRVSLPIHVSDRQPKLSGAQTKAYQTPCKDSSAFSRSSPVLAKSTTSIMNPLSVDERSVKEDGTRKRNLSEFTDSPSTLTDETIEERRWIPPSQRAPANIWCQFNWGPEILSPKITRFDSSNEYGDISYRKRLDDMSLPRSKVDACDSIEDIGNEFYSSGRNHDSSYKEKGWSQAAFEAINVVAGKAWEFCKNSTAIFRGFHAGGGTRYKLKYNEDSELYFEAFENIIPEKKENFYNPSSSHLSGGCSQTPQPISSNCSDEIKLDSSSHRPSKRYQLSRNNNDSLERNWVVVPTMSSTPNKTFHGLSAKRKVLSTGLPRYAPSHTRTPSSYTASRSTGGSSTYRRPSLRTVRPLVSHAGSPNLSSTQCASFASPRSPGGYIPRLATPNKKIIQNKTQEVFLGSPTTLESKRQAQKLATMLKKGVKRQDESIQRLDERLKEMIRQGKEALGSKFEVSMEDYEENEIL
ncbi:hypothetical protein EV44_g1145 [Erysiphe necator]|uniref:Uncharacterized protein n=1 Tax=Uncinula necator TaxID=52586 RepID=A0A0B1P9N9_UNCNE|nr:hypothetical protein EV44_g1145 [Erysiphe necator]